MPDTDDSQTNITPQTLTVWADNCLRMNHLGTLVQRELKPRPENLRAINLSERARKLAWRLFNDLVKFGAKKPEGFCEAKKIEGWLFEGVTTPVIQGLEFEGITISAGNEENEIKLDLEVSIRHGHIEAIAQDANRPAICLQLCRKIYPTAD